MAPPSGTKSTFTSAVCSRRPLPQEPLTGVVASRMPQPRSARSTPSATTIWVQSRPRTVATRGCGIGYIGSVVIRARWRWRLRGPFVALAGGPHEAWLWSSFLVRSLLVTVAPGGGVQEDEPPGLL